MPLGLSKTPTDADAVQAGWTGTHNQTGYYRLKFGTGEGNTARYGAEHWVPEPGTFAMLLLGLSGLALCRRRG